MGVTKYDVPALNGLSSNHFEKDPESPKLHANNGDQQSPETPPPFGDAKDSDDDNNDQESGGVSVLRRCISSSYLLINLLAYS